MLQRFIAVTLIVFTGLLTACGDVVQPNSSQPTSATENTIQFKFPDPPSAEMKNKLKQEKYQMQHSSRNSAGEEK